MDNPDIQAFNAMHNKVDDGDREDWQWKWCMEGELGVRLSTIMGRMKVKGEKTSNVKGFVSINVAV
jgi:hypothetical protein